MFATANRVEKQVLTKWSQAVVHFGYQLTVSAFFTSLVAALLAVGFAVYGLFGYDSRSWIDGIVVWAFIMVSLVLFLVGMFNQVGHDTRVRACLRS